MKNPPCQKAWRVRKLYQLFSSFLRGASRPKSPRDAGIPATPFMLELKVIVKPKVKGKMGEHQFANLLRQTLRRTNVSCETRPDGQLTSRRI
jgi:hypothetical protein